MRSVSFVEKNQSKPEYSVMFAIPSHVGSLQEVLGIFKNHNVDLTNIESRPSAVHEAAYQFSITTRAPWESVSAAVEQLKTEARAKGVLVLDNNPATTNPAWFPRTMRDLDVFGSRVLGYGAELDSDHPGFTDPAYRQRRLALAALARDYRHGQPLPRIDYTPDEIRTWGEVYRQLKSLYPTHACKEHLRVFPLLVENCGYREDNIPQLEDVSRFLHHSTGFRLRPVPGLLSSRDFLAGLAFRVFHSTQYIRHHTRPLYTPEPDVCHELLGHVPLFADKHFAEFSQEIGLASLGASDADVQRLATCYWFTVEFGLCREEGALKAYGAGLLSSFGELKYSLSESPKLQPFEPAVTAEQKYPITEYQPIYFVADSFASAKDKMIAYAASLDKPFVCRYDALRESISILDSNQAINQLAESVRSDMSKLVQALHLKA